MTIPQITVLALAVATILFPAGWILYHDLTGRPLDDKEQQRRSR